MLLTRLISQLMPPSCIALHGTAVDTEGQRFALESGKRKTEDDILVVDRDRIPSLLFAEGEGIVPIEAVLARIEVKSVLTKQELRDAVYGSMSFLKVPLVLPDEDLQGGAALQCIFAFASDLAEMNEHARLTQLVQGERWDCIEGGTWNEETPPIHALCVVGKGMWAFGSRSKGEASGWGMCPADDVHSEVATFLALLLNTLPALREKRRSARLGSHLIDVEQQFRPV
ncbi:MAG: hypothetical protein DMF64_12045 [Acidobacteria bacterium]|nr:MAG: hypothetical protein DMF64_12045 [Acidobacteriota bacterium]